MSRNDGTQREKIYTNNTLSEPVPFSNTTYGLTDTAFVHITWIDNIAPTATSVSYTPSTNTNTDVEVRLEASERVYLPAGRT
jgi:hypothetical protein